MTTISPIDKFLEKQGVIVLDGGLATELEQMGYVLGTRLWSAHLLCANPEAIRDAHLAYLKAGADVITTASYQASIEGFISEGFSADEAVTLMKISVSVAEEARKNFTKSSEFKKSKRPKPLIAASIGPYGAYLADGSEFRGNYGITKKQLYDFHKPRWDILATLKADLFAIETIPSFAEAEVILELLQQTPDIPAWVSFSCKDEKHINDGTLIKKCAALFNNCPQVYAIGVNCTAPKYISSLIKEIQKTAPSKQVVVYPNSGEIWNTKTREWIGLSEPLCCGQAARDWHKAGARLIGGCCRLGPEQISAMRENLIVA